LNKVYKAKQPIWAVMNVILVTIDCLRADHLSCMGYIRNTSPFIDTLAKEGMVFSEAIVNGAGTFASFTALLTSTYPFMRGGFEKLNRKTIAEVLKKRGYRTAGFNDNGFLSPYFGFDRGFDYFNCLSVQQKKTQIGKLLDKFRKVVGDIAQMTFGSDCNMNGKTVTKLVLDWLKENYKYDFFLWIHYMDVHGPHYAPRSYYTKIGVKPPSLIELYKLNRKLGNNPSELYKKGEISNKDIELLKNTYDAEIRYVDDCVSKLFNTLDSLGIKKKTTLIIAGDHGEEFFEHGGYHSNLNLYDEMIRIPLIIYGPNVPKKRVNTQVRQIDIAPTILKILNEDCEIDFLGKDLIDNAGSKYVITEAAYYSISGDRSGKIVDIDFSLRKTSIRAEINGQKWKYIYCMKHKVEEFYNLTKDPLERNNLIKSKKNTIAKEILEELENILMLHLKREEEEKRLKTKLKLLKIK